MPRPERPVPRVVYLVGNDIENDARVRKYLRSAVDAGFDVAIVGLSTSGHDDELVLDGARAIRCAVARPTSPPAVKPGVAAVPKARPRTGWLAVQRRRVRSLPRRFDQLLRRAGRPRSLRPPQQPEPGSLSKEQQLAIYLADPDQARWRDVLPELQRYEEVLGPVLDELDGDLLHAHDVFLLGVAVNAAERARARDHDRAVPVIYDAHEYLPGLAGPPARTTAAFVDHEREYLPRVDRVITVSDPIADELQRVFGLEHRPSLVINAPIIDPPTPDAPSVRSAAGITDDAPIVLYGGGLAHARGVHTVVEALPQIPGAHLVVVSRAPSHYTRELQALAAALGCADRYHEVGFVDSTQVVTYFTSATVGITPLLHAGNHDWALTNKFLEYIHAGLPVVTSDTEVQDRLVRELGIGEVFVAGDVDGCAAAVRAVLADLERYREPLRDPELLNRLSWPAQADVFLGLYRELLGPVAARGADPVAGDVTLDGSPSPRRSGTSL